MKPGTRSAAARDSRPVLGRHSSILALVPHFQCEEWLGDTLESLLSQTRPLDGIAVIDDHSESPPLDIVRRFPRVTLYTAAENVGPYRLIQEIIERTRYDGYLFNDADDWSARERLEVLLAEAERTGAELIGSQEIRVICDEAEALPYNYPRDVNAALREQPCSFPLLHPTSLISRKLVIRLGGFATGMRFSGDAEILRRAGYAGRIVNVPEYLYFRRKRAGALTTSPETGLRSPARLEVQRTLWDRAIWNAALAKAGEQPDLAPIAVAGPIELTHLCGPDLSASQPNRAATSRWLRRLGTRLRDRYGVAVGKRKGEDEPRPVFLIGPPRSGVGLLTWSLSQHPGLAASGGTPWLGKLALRLQSVVGSADATAGGAARDFPRWTDAEFWGTFSGTIDELRPTSATGRWVDGTPENVFHVYGLLQLFPAARFIHVVRDVAEVVTSLASLPASDGSYFTEETAAERWLQAAWAGVVAERALGSKRVLRIRHADLVTAPEETIRRCLDHIEEPFAAACLRPLATLKPALKGMTGTAGAPPSFLRRQAERLSQELLEDPAPSHPGGPELLSEMAAEYRARSERGTATVADGSTVRRVREVARMAVPQGSTVLVVSRGDDDLLELEGSRGWHFPQSEDGTYAGYHPADGDEAVAHLERLRRSGADFLLLPCTAFWWLDFYAELREHLERHCRLAAYQENAGLVYALQPPGDRLEVFPALRFATAGQAASMRAPSVEGVAT